MNAIKALIPGTLLTLLVSAVLAAQGVRSSSLALEHASIGQHHFYWSWPLFVIATALMLAFVWATDSG